LKRKAELSISLRNVGDEKYKPDLYGSRIIIERKLAKDGQSLYRIFNDASNCGFLTNWFVLNGIINVVLCL
jgi:hypothetical protein